jgi:hypothetical protein
MIRKQLAEIAAALLIVALLISTTQAQELTLSSKGYAQCSALAYLINGKQHTPKSSEFFRKSKLPEKSALFHLGYIAGYVEGIASETVDSKYDIAKGMYNKQCSNLVLTSSDS